MAMTPSPSAVAEAVLPAAPRSGEDKEADCLKQWLALNSSIERLQKLWSSVERWLVNEHGWLALSMAEQKQLPAARILRQLDHCFDRLSERRDRILGEVEETKSASAQLIILRLAVAESLVWPDDAPEAHALITGARRDLITLASATM